MRPRHFWWWYTAQVEASGKQGGGARQLTKGEVIRLRNWMDRTNARAKDQGRG